MIPSFQARCQTLLRPWWCRFASWGVGGFCGGLLCLGSLVLLMLAPMLEPLVFVLPPAAMIYGFAWSWLLVRRVARSSGIPLENSSLEHAPPWQWHLGLLLGIPLFWLFMLVALTIFIQPGESVAAASIPPPPAPDAARAGGSDSFLAIMLLSTTVFGALVGRSTVALWEFVAPLRRTMSGSQPIQKGVWR